MDILITAIGSLLDAVPINNEENELTTVGKSNRLKKLKKSKPTIVEYVGALLDAGENRSK